MGKDTLNEIECELTLTETMQEVLIENFDMEIDLIQGKTETLPDGRSIFKMRLSGVKADIMVMWFKAIMSTPSDEVTVKIDGHKIHQN